MEYQFKLASIRALAESPEKLQKAREATLLGMIEEIEGERACHSRSNEEALRLYSYVSKFESELQRREAKKQEERAEKLLQAKQKREARKIEAEKARFLKKEEEEPFLLTMKRLETACRIGLASEPEYQFLAIWKDLNSLKEEGNFSPASINRIKELWGMKLLSEKETSREWRKVFGLPGETESSSPRLRFSLTIPKDSGSGFRLILSLEVKTEEAKLREYETAFSLDSSRAYVCRACYQFTKKGA